MPANSPYSPTLVKKSSSLDIMSSIAESFSFIAKDLAEYVKIKTGKEVSSSSPTADTSSKSLSPTPNIDFVSGDSKKPKDEKKGFFGKMMKMFSAENIMTAFMGLAIIAGIMTLMWHNFKDAFTSFFSNLWESIKEGLDKIGEWFGELFGKAGELLTGLLDKVKDFIAPIIDKVTSFVSSIGDWFSDKFDAIKKFLFGSNLPPPGPSEVPDEATNNITVDTENVSSHLSSSKGKVTGQSLVKERKDEIKQMTRKKKAANAKRKGNKTPSPVTNVRTTKFKESSSTIPTPTASSGGMDATKAMIIQHEGLEYKPYQDSENLWTVGVGHLIGPTLPPEMDRTFSHAEVMDMFDKDFAHHKQIAERTPGYGKANEAGKAAFVDLAFNMGKWWPGFPNAADALNQGKFSLAANELVDSKWYTQVGGRGDTVVNLVASAGSGQGTTLASSSNNNSVQKRGMGSGGQQLVVNSGTVNNNTIVKNVRGVSTKRENTGDIANRIT
jgi:GH24 family phage-related lysozyme (muramidase)